MTPQRGLDPVGEHARDEERRRRRLQDPDVRSRLREIHEEMERGDPPGPGITSKELDDFLRERQ
jgi:hypothetical protein